MMRSLWILVVVTAGCSLPIAPSDPVATERDQIDAAIALIRASTDRLPIAPETSLIDWFNARVESVEVFSDAGMGGMRNGRRVFVNRNLLTSPVHLAAVLLHEARHADVLHTCGRHPVTGTADKDQPGEFGAWAVHAWWLNMQGDTVNGAGVLHANLCW